MYIQRDEGINTHTIDQVEASKSGLTNSRVSRKHPAQTEAAVVGDSGVEQEYRHPKTRESR